MHVIGSPITYYEGNPSQALPTPRFLPLPLLPLHMGIVSSLWFVGLELMKSQRKTKSPYHYTNAL